MKNSIMKPSFIADLCYVLMRSDRGDSWELDGRVSSKLSAKIALAPQNVLECYVRRVRETYFVSYL
jgi:hypothetical protein